MLHTIIIIEWTQFQATNTIRKLSSPVGKVIDITMATALTKFTKVYNSSWADGFCVSKGNVRVWVLYPRAMKRPSISVFFIACFLILVIEATSQQHESLSRTSEERHANFEKHPHTFLDVTAIAIRRVIFSRFSRLPANRDFYPRHANISQSLQWCVLFLSDQAL